MESMAPVASPTPIICVTMLGKTPHSRSGSTMVRPSSIALRTFINASSSTLLPEVRAVIQAFENWNAGGNERAQGSGETGTCDLAQQQAEDGQLEQHGVKVIAATRVLADLLDAIDQASAAHNKGPPEMAHEITEADDNAGGQRKRNSQADEEVGKDRHHPLEQRPYDQHGKGDDGYRVDQRRLDGR